MGRIRVLGLAVLLAACAPAPARITGCAAQDGLEPVCGFAAPEDMELLPDGHTLVVGQFADSGGAGTGGFVLFDTASATITRLPLFTEAATETWGSAECATPPGPGFAAHGTSLRQRADGRWQLLAVNHVGRESVEFFEPLAGAAGWRLAWRGCALPPPGSYLNDVAALPDGGFVATHMFDARSPKLGPFSIELLKAAVGLDTGYVLHWDGSGFERVKGSEAPFPNGIQTSADGGTLFVDVYMDNRVRKLRLADGALLGEAEVEHPDNIQWNAGGKLLVASHAGGLREIAACEGVTDGACGAGFAVVEIDPATMAARTVFEHRGAPMGAATVAQQVGDALYLGSFVGDRVLKVPYRP